MGITYMTFELIRNKLIKNVWLVVATVVIANVSLFANTSSSSYLSSITVGLNINNTQYQNLLVASNNFASNTYDKILEDLSLYLSNRFAAPDIQSEISENAKLGERIDTKKPFYDIKNQSAGFVNISYTAASKAGGENFISSVNNVFLSKIVTEWNRDRPQVFSIDQINKNKVDFNNSIIEVKSPIQNRLLPTIGGLLIGILGALVLPQSKPNSKNKTINE
jgi:hypothetical protein